MKPVRLAVRKSPPSHHRADAWGSTAQLSATVLANTPPATAAWRNLRVSSRYGMKISGTSFTPAASPMPAPPPAAGGLAQVPHDERHQQQLDLPEVQRTLHRLGPERGRGDRGGQAQPGPPGPAQLARGQPDRTGQRGHAGRSHQPQCGRPGQRRHGGEQQRGERRVGEPGPGQQLPAVQPGRAVPHQQAGAAVHPQVEPGQHEPERMAGDGGGVQPGRGGQRQQASRGQEAERGAVTHRTQRITKSSYPRWSLCAGRRGRPARR